MNKLLFLLPFAVLSAGAAEVDGIAAQVGTESILRSEVLQEISRFGEQDGERYQEFLDHLINRKLILKAARDSKMVIQEWMVENRNRELINTAFGGDRNKLLEVLSRQKISYPEWYARRKEDMIIDAMRWTVVSKFVSASPAEMKRMYAENPERYVTKHKVSLSVVYLTDDDADRKVEVDAKFKETDVEAIGGKKYVDIEPQELFKPEICKVIEKLTVGETSGWLSVEGCQVLLRKDAEKPSARLDFAEAYDMIEADVKEAAAMKAEKAWVDRLRAETYIKVF